MSKVFSAFYAERDLICPAVRRKRRIDDRTRRDRTENRNRAFQLQLPKLIDAYMQHIYNRDHDTASSKPSEEDSGEDGATRAHTIHVVDMHGMSPNF